MGHILDELLEEVKESDVDEQVRIICDKIFEEESDGLDPAYNNRPNGANIFLSLPINPRAEMITYLVLQREAQSEYAVSMWTTSLPGAPSMIRNTWPIKESKPEKIMKAYAERLKWAKGD